MANHWKVAAEKVVDIHIYLKNNNDKAVYQNIQQIKIYARYLVCLQSKTG